MLVGSRWVALLLSAGWALTAASSAPAAPGDLDPTFGGDGVVTTNTPRRWGQISDVAIQPDGKIVVAGWAYKHDDFPNAGPRPFGVFMLARYKPDGTLDRRFGGDGIVRTGFSRRHAGARAVAVQANGRIVAAGRAGRGSRGSFALVRYRPSGRLDRSFGGDGKVRTDFTRWNDYALDLVLQRNGKIVAGGRAGRAGGRFALARYRPDGRLDSGFSRDGKATSNFSGEDDFVTSLARRRDGTIVAGGVELLFRLGALALYNRDGTLDSKSRRGTEGDNWISEVALRPDGQIVAAGQQEDYPALFLPDSTVTCVFGECEYGAVRGLAIQSDGQIVASGDAFELARFDPDGTLDPTFGTEGMVTTRFRVAAIALQTDGKIVTAGTVSVGSGATAGSHFAVARYLAE